MENNEPNYKMYTWMRKYTRDIENRYQPPILLKKMTNRYLGLRLEGMDKVMEKL